MKKNIESIYPLSPMQQGMLFHTLHEPQAGMYFEQFSCTLQGALEAAALKRACQQVMEHHPVLRTAFVWENPTRPLQVVFREVALPWAELDWRAIPAPEHAARLDEWMLADQKQGFDLARPPLMRMTLIRLSDDTYRFIWSHHHMLLDGWSLPIVLKEIFYCYEFFRRGETPTLTPARPYKDYIAWLQRQDMAEAETFWKKTLADLAAPTLLAETIGARLDETPRHTEQQFHLSAETTARLENLARQRRLTLSTLIQAAWAMLLGRYCNQSDVTFGITVSGRPAELSGVEAMVGLFINTLPLRARLDPERALADWLTDLQAQQVEMRQYEYSPLAQIQAWSPLPRGLPLFDSLLVFENYPLENTFRDAQLSLCVRDIRGSERTNYPLTVVAIPRAVEQQQDGLLLKMNYNTRRFDDNTITRLAGRLQNLLQGIAANPDARLDDLELLDESERHRILVEWNETAHSFGEPACLHQLFEQQARRAPNAIALRELHDWGDVYDDLDSTAVVPHTLDKLELACVRKNPYLYWYAPAALAGLAYLDEIRSGHASVVQTEQGNVVALNQPLRALLDYFDGQSNLRSLFERLARDANEFELYTFKADAGQATLERQAFVIEGQFENLAALVKALYQAGLVNIAGFERQSRAGPPIHLRREAAPAPADSLSAISGRPPLKAARAPVLLLGANTGPASVGLLYLAAFLRRHGVMAWCQPNDVCDTRDRLEQNVQQLLETYRPKLVGISLKWFPHIARALEICRLVKQYAPDVTTVLGGDTASYFCDELAANEWVDYVIRGDGELPLLKLALGEEPVPNAVYRQDGQIVKTPLDYVHSAQNTADIYLSHLDETIVSKNFLLHLPYVFVFTGQGCSMQCFYCAGACENQRRVFGRAAPYLRPVELVRQDIEQALPFTSTLMFDFDLPHYDSIEYYRKLWEGLDLKSHYGIFYFWQAPSPEFVDLVARTFKYATLDIDLCSLSERHRLHLAALKVVKPQPTDEQLLAALDACDKHANVQITLSLISGLPFMTEADLVASQTMCSHLLDTYRCFAGLEWGRLHAQPGAPITLDYGRFDMEPSASSFQDYLKHSQANLEQERYPDVASLDYPLIYYRDRHINSLTSKHYADLSQQIARAQEQRRRAAQFYVEEVSYGELDARANQLANYLRRQGVGPETRVAICASKTLSTIVAILGALKAGGAFTPLDPDAPTERLAFMLQDSGATVLLTQAHLTSRLPAFGGALARLDEDWPLIAQEPAAPPASGVEPDNLAYVIYTSGSTGRPKGVMVEHHSICNLVQSQIASFGLTPASRVLQFASLSFDAAVSEIFTTLLSGGTLYLAQPGMLLGDGLTQILRSQAITTVTLPPTLLAALEAARLPKLETIISAGEACPWEVVDRWARGRRLLNFYGPTEATVGACYYQADQRQDTRSAPIGRPIDNVRLYVVDSRLKPMPIGAPGELLIGGAGVARGYLNRPDLTAEKFIPHPSALIPHPSSPRLYRTGDLVRWLPDGNLEFLGRIDHQVKIRGYRIELGEIEAVLSQHPAVREAVVIMREDRPGDRRLVAYFIPAVKPPPSMRELRRHLKGWLADYMTPADFIALESWPLTPSGKVDRQALPAPERGVEASAFVAPRTPVEQQLADIWSQVLGVKQVGIHNNFFELGGDSILSIQVVSRAAQAGLHLTVKQIFQHPTIAELAQVVEVSRASAAEQTIVTGPVPLTPIQHWFFELELPEPHHFNQAFLFEARARLEPALLEQAYVHLLRHHDALRLSYGQTPQGWQQICREPEAAAPFAVVDVSSASPDELPRLIETHAAQAQASLSLQGPLTRIIWFERGQQPGYLLWICHHLIVDIVSWGTLVEDLMNAYRQLAQKAPVQLPPKTSSYKQWAERLIEYAGSGAVRAELDYWLGELQDTLALPVDRPGENTQADSRMLTMPLTVEETQALLHKTPQAFRAAVNEILLAALAHTLAQWIGAGSVTVNLEGHGRHELFRDIDLSRTVGWFTTVYPLRLPLDPARQLEDTVRLVKENYRRTPNHGIGYGLLRYLHPDAGLREQLRALPAPQLSFNYVGQARQSNQPDALLVPSLYPTGSPISLQGRRAHLLDIVAGATGDQLELTVVYNQRLYHQAAIQQLASGFMGALRALIQRSAAPQAEALTPSDFPAAQASQQDLDRLMAALGRKARK